jgi:hypothetical protein
VGFFLGCLAAPHLLGRPLTTHAASTPATTSLDYPVPALIGLGEAEVVFPGADSGDGAVDGIVEGDHGAGVAALDRRSRPEDQQH